MTKFDELKERFPNLIPVQELRSNVSIIELAVQYGYEPLPHKGRSRPVLEHPGYKDTIIIKNPQDAAQQVYQRAGDFSDSGTIIDFIRNRLSTVFSTFNRPGEHEFRNITAVLYDYLKIDPDQVSQNSKMAGRLSEPGTKQPFTKEQFDIRPLEPQNYLTTRQIAPQTLERPEFAGKIVAQIAYLNPETGHTEPYQSVKANPDRKYITFSNVAFPYYNGLSTEVTGLELRNQSIKLHAPGSDRYGSVFVSNPPPKATYFHIMESAVDVLSHRQLRSIRGDEAFDSVYFSTGGQLTGQQVNTITRYIGSFEKTDNWQIRLGFDNDAKGHRFDLQFVQQLTATRFPLTATVASPERVAYLLPEEEKYKAGRDIILERIDLFNKNVQAQFVRSEGDALGQKELSAQLINIGRSGQQFQISIPESAQALSMMSRLLLEVTQMEKKIALDKSCGKDFNLDLTKAVKVGNKFRYAIQNDVGNVLLNGNSAIQMARSLQQVRNLAEMDKFTGWLLLVERQPFGFLKTQAEIKLEQGVCVMTEQTPAFSQAIQLERQARNVQEPGGLRQEKQPLNPDARPVIKNQEPDRQLKRKL
ncbi:hypothetical protein GCM10023189_32660 [Nibrella saemangeumensis]|uniref:Toprim-like n=1 Tax=Nibrella saemangeumensis TaxID=1084526 RepID=A0ABP8N436_9BACT